MAEKKFPPPKDSGASPKGDVKASTKTPTQPTAEIAKKADCHKVPSGFQQGSFKNLGQCAT